MTEPSTTAFGRYRLVERIAMGGMAEIFIAKAVGAMGFEKQVVIKRILPQFAADPEFLRMFVTEAKLVCHLEHPNIVQVHELSEIEGQYFIAMEHVKGIDGRQLWRTLAKRKQRLPAVLALVVVGEFLKGLDYAHSAVGPDNEVLGVVHRDVSPSNILISYRGDVKIGDFGIALVQQESKTQAGVLKGKYGYMSPEQVAGLAVDQRSDIFAAGIVLAELLLGRRLFLGRSDFETLDRVLNVRLDVLERHEEALPADVVRIVRQALQREPDDRYPSAREFHEAINDCLFAQPQRVTTETLATFIGQHVAPHIVDGSGERSAVESGSAPPRMPAPAELVPKDLRAGALHDPGLGEPVEAPVAPVAPVDPPPVERVEPSPAEGVALGRVKLERVPAAQAKDAPSRSVALDLEAEVPQGSPAVAPAAEQVPAPESPPDDPSTLASVGSSSWPEVGEFELAEPEDLAAAGQAAPPSYVPEDRGVEEGGAGEELDLSSCEDEDDFYPDPTGGSEPTSGPVSLVGDQPMMYEAQLTPASETVEAAVTAVAPDFAGQLSHRTAIKVIFRFAVVNETGLLTLTGPDRVAQEQADHLGWIAELRRDTGAHAAVSEARTCEIHLQDGQPHLVAADRDEESLVAQLLATGELDKGPVDRALRAQRHRGLVAALLAEGLLSPLQVSRYVTSFVLRSVVECFDWVEGDFAFFRGRECSHEAFPTGLSALEFIWQGTEAISDATLHGYFEQLAGRRVQINSAPPALIETFPADPRLRAVYNAIRNPQTVEEVIALCAAHGSTVDLRRALYTLLECELGLVQ